MTLWITVLAAAALGFALKLAGYLVPPSTVEGPRRSRVISLLPVALLAGLLLTQTLGGSDGLTVDARVPAVVVVSHTLVRPPTRHQGAPAPGPWARSPGRVRPSTRPRLRRGAGVRDHVRSGG